MIKLLATLIAAAFFAVSMNSVAVAASAGDPPKAEAKAKKKNTAKKPAKPKKESKKSSKNK